MSEFTGAPRTFWRDMVRTFVHNRPGMLGVVLILFFLIFSIWGLIGTPSNTNRSRLSTRLESPSAAHLFGTDNQDRHQESNSSGGATRARSRSTLRRWRGNYRLLAGSHRRILSKKGRNGHHARCRCFACISDATARSCHYGYARRRIDQHHDRRWLFDIASIRSGDASGGADSWRTRVHHRRALGTMCGLASEAADGVVMLFTRDRQSDECHGTVRDAFRLFGMPVVEPTWKPAPRYGLAPVSLGFQGGCHF